MELNQRQNLIIASFLLLSLLLHLLLLLIPQSVWLRPVEPSQPVYVEMRPPERRDRELDLPESPTPPKPRETPAKRLGPQDQVVKRETSPGGEDRDDALRGMRAARTQPAPAPAWTPPAPPATVTPAETEPRPVTPLGERPLAAPQATPRPTPTLDQLTKLTPTTMTRIESDWRRKYREGVEKGDTVWLDTEQDLLISFFKRFRTNIYNVWNYPERARMREEQGECLLRIVVSRQGRIDDVQLLESSGSRDLDDEAIRAVRNGAPYGPLPSVYPHEQLNIMAYFRYSLSNTVKYPGQIRGAR